MRPALLAAITLAAGATALSALTVTTTAAAPAHPAPAGHRTVDFALHHAGTHGLVAGFNQDGGNWSGYAATGSGFSSVTSTWTEPSVTCNSTNDLFAPWVGIDGYGTSTVEQTGVATDCSSGSPQYAGWYEMYPAAPVYYSNAVGAGDVIKATVTRSGSTYTLTLSDTSRGWTRTTTKSLSRARNASAEVIMESPTAAYPRFGTVNFSGSTVNGSALSNFGPVALDASNSGGFEDRTSALSGGNFSISYLRE